MRVIRREDILVKMSTLVILKSGDKIPVKEALFWIMDCPKCGVAICDPDEADFVKQAETCFECTTGNCLDFCVRSLCRTIHPERVAETRVWCERIAPATSTFRVVPHFRTGWVEFHWNYDPSEAYLRIREKMLKIGRGLTTEEIHAALQDTIRHGIKGCVTSSA